MESTERNREGLFLFFFFFDINFNVILQLMLHAKERFL